MPKPMQLGNKYPVTEKKMQMSTKWSPSSSVNNRLIMYFTNMIRSRWKFFPKGFQIERGKKFRLGNTHPRRFHQKHHLNRDKLSKHSSLSIIRTTNCHQWTLSPLFKKHFTRKRFLHKLTLVDLQSMDLLKSLKFSLKKHHLRKESLINLIIH